MRGNASEPIAFAVAENQLYASHYLETALDLTFCVQSAKDSGFFLITLVGSEQARLAGVKGSVVRTHGPIWVSELALLKRSFVFVLSPTLRQGGPELPLPGKLPRFFVNNSGAALLWSTHANKNNWQGIAADSGFEQRCWLSVLGTISTSSQNQPLKCEVASVRWYRQAYRLDWLLSTMPMISTGNGVAVIRTNHLNSAKWKFTNS
jgi:hypothetical protein